MPNFIQMKRIYKTKNSAFEIKVYIKTKRKKKVMPGKQPSMEAETAGKQGSNRKCRIEKLQFHPKMSSVHFPGTSNSHF